MKSKKILMVFLLFVAFWIIGITSANAMVSYTIENVDVENGYKMVYCEPNIKLELYDNNIISSTIKYDSASIYYDEKIPNEEGFDYKYVVAINDLTFNYKEGTDEQTRDMELNLVLPLPENFSADAVINNLINYDEWGAYRSIWRFIT